MEAQEEAISDAEDTETELRALVAREQDLNSVHTDKIERLHSQLKLYKQKNGELVADLSAKEKELADERKRQERGRAQKMLSSTRPTASTNFEAEAASNMAFAEAARLELVQIREDSRIREDSAQRKLDEFKSQCQDLEQRQASTSAHLNEARLALATARTALAARERQSKTLDNEMRELKRALAEQEVVARTAEALVKELRSELGDITNTCTDQNDQIQELQATLETLNGQSASLSSQLRACRKERDDANNSLAALDRESHRVHSAKVARLTAELEAANVARTRAEEEARKATVRMRTFAVQEKDFEEQTLFSRPVQEADHELASKQARAAEVSWGREREHLKEAKCSAEDTVRELRKANEDLHADYLKVKGAADTQALALKAELQNARDERDDYEKKYDTAVQGMKNAQREVSSKTAQLKRTEAARQRLARSENDVQGEVASLRAKLHATQGTQLAHKDHEGFDAAAHSNAKLRAQLKVLESQVATTSELRGKHDSNANHKVVELEKRVQELADALENEKANKWNSDTQNCTLKLKIAELEEEIDHLQSNADRFSYERDDLALGKLALMEELATLRAATTSSAAKERRLKTDLEVAQTALESAAAKLSAQHSETAKLKQKVATLSGQAEGAARAMEKLKKQNKGLQEDMNAITCQPIHNLAQTAAPTHTVSVTPDATLSTKLALAQGRTKNAQDAAERAQRAAADAVKRANTAENDLCTCNKALADARLKLKTSQQQLTTALAEVSTLTASLSWERKCAEDLRADASAANKEASSLRAQVNAARPELETLRDDCSRMRRQLDMYQIESVASAALAEVVCNDHSQTSPHVELQERKIEQLEDDLRATKQTLQARMSENAALHGKATEYKLCLDDALRREENERRQCLAADKRAAQRRAVRSSDVLSVGMRLHVDQHNDPSWAVTPPSSPRRDQIVAMRHRGLTGTAKGSAAAGFDGHVEPGGLSRRECVEFDAQVVESRLSRRLDLPTQVTVALNMQHITVFDPDGLDALREPLTAIRVCARSGDLTCIEFSGPSAESHGVLYLATESAGLTETLKTRMAAKQVAVGVSAEPPEPIHHPTSTEFEMVVLAPSTLAEELRLPPTVGLVISGQGITLTDAEGVILFRAGYRSVLQCGAVAGIVAIQFGPQSRTPGTLHFKLNQEVVNVVEAYMKQFQLQLTKSAKKRPRRVDRDAGSSMHQ